jgi:hypothetical protein
MKERVAMKVAMKRVKATVRDAILDRYGILLPEEPFACASGLAVRARRSATTQISSTSRRSRR